MVDEIDAYLSSPYSSDLRRTQRVSMSDCAKNMRNAKESIEEYNARMAKFREENQQKIIAENTDVLQERLANLDISNIATKNRMAIEALIREAQSIKNFAYNNMYNTSSIDFTTLNKAVEVANARLKSLKNGNQNTDLGTGIYADTYRSSKDKNSDILQKLLNNKKK